MRERETNSPKRILMTADAVGGVWTYALDLARGLEPFGVEIFLATMGPLPSSDQLKEARSIRNLRLFKSEYKLEWMDESSKDVERAGHWLLSLEKRLKPDIVHLNGYVHGALPFEVPKVVVGHSCVLSWWRAVKRSQPPSHLQEYREMVRKGLRSAEIVIAPTAAMMSELEENYGRLRRKAVIKNGSQINNISSKEKSDIILAAGRVWDEAKNISLLTRIADRVPGCLFIAGDDADPSRRQTEDTGKAIRLGRLSKVDLARHMNEAAIFAAPALYEPFGLAPLEAALSGCALVLGDIPSLREVWGEAAVFVSPMDEEMWCRTLTELMNDKSKLRRYSAMARRKAMQMSLDRMAAAYHRIYVDLTERRKEIAREETTVCA
jgi:glycogen synthase